MIANEIQPAGYVSFFGEEQSRNISLLFKTLYLSPPYPFFPFFFAFSFFFAASLLVVKSIKLSVRLAELHHLAAVKAKQTR